ncbi:MAG: hypothetical protein HYU53_13120 [Acidobacteria bacterium]|nr:hypothetical protein [Acidobacteriota bacterium]
MAKAKRRAAGRKGAAKRRRKATKPARKRTRKMARKTVRKTARRTTSKKTSRKPPGRTPRASARLKARPTAKGGRSPYLERERKRLPEVEEEDVQGPPSSLDLDRHPSAARTGREELREALREHTETSPALTGGDVDADWENAYSSGEEAPGGDNPTPDQQRVDDIGKALGVEYQDNEELRGVDKIDDRDKKRWELDPASAEDYRERQK